MNSWRKTTLADQVHLTGESEGQHEVHDRGRRRYEHDQ